MRLAAVIRSVRFAILGLPLFGLVNAMQLGCEATVADDISQQGDAVSHRGYGGGYGDGYDDYSYGGYDDVAY